MTAIVQSGTINNDACIVIEDPVHLWLSLSIARIAAALHRYPCRFFPRSFSRPCFSRRITTFQESRVDLFLSLVLLTFSFCRPFFLSLSSSPSFTVFSRFPLTTLSSLFSLLFDASRYASFFDIPAPSRFRLCASISTTTTPVHSFPFRDRIDRSASRHTHRSHGEPLFCALECAPQDD